MKHIRLSLFVCVLAIGLILNPVAAQTPTHTWKASPVDTDWANPANWDQGTVPGVGHTARIDYCTTCPTLTSNLDIDHLVVYGGQINLADKQVKAITVQFQYVTIQSQGANLEFAWHYWVGNSVYGPISLYYNNPQLSGYQSHNLNYYFGDFSYKLNIGTAFVSFNSTLVASSNPAVASPKFTLDVQKGSIALANIIFPGQVELSSLDQGYIYFGNDGNVTFKDNVKITHNSVNDVYAYTRFAPTDGYTTTFEKEVDVTAGTGYVLFGVHGDCIFQGDVTVQSTPTVGNYLSGVYFGDYSTTGQQTFQGLLTIGSQSNPAASFKCPNLRIANATFQTTQPQTWYMEGGGKCTLHNTTLAGKLETTAPHIFLTGNTFYMPLSLTKTANGDDVCYGGNTFHGKVTLKNTAQSGRLLLASQADDTIVH